MALFKNLQNNFLINISNRYLLTRRFFFVYSIFLLQGFVTYNVLAAGLSNVENELTTTQQAIDKARNNLKRLKQKRNSQIMDKFWGYDNELKEIFGSQNNYYPEVIKSLEAYLLESLDLHKKYSSEKENIEEKILYNETLQGILEKGFTAIEKLIQKNDEEYYKAQSEADRNTLVKNQKFLLKIKKELKEASYPDAIHLDNYKQGGSEYNVVNTDHESIYENNPSDHSSIVKILRKTDLSPQDLGDDDNTKETLSNKLRKVNKNLRDLEQNIGEIEHIHLTLNKEKDNYDQLSSSIKSQQDEIARLLKRKNELESDIQHLLDNEQLLAANNQHLVDNDQHIAVDHQHPEGEHHANQHLLDNEQLLAANNQHLVYNDQHIAVDYQHPVANGQSLSPNFSVQPEVLPSQVEPSVVTPLILDTPNLIQSNNETGIAQINTKSLYDEIQELLTKNDGNYKPPVANNGNNQFNIELPRSQHLQDEGYFSYYSTAESEEIESTSDFEDESHIVPRPSKRFSRSSSLAPADPQYYLDTSNLDPSDESSTLILQSQSLKIDKTKNEAYDQEAALSQNSNEVPVVTFPLPITQEQLSTTHAVVDQVAVYNVDNKQGVSENNIEPHGHENPAKFYRTKRQKRSTAVHDNAGIVHNEIFDEDNLGLKELFKEKVEPILDVQPWEVEHPANQHIADNDQPPADNVQHLEDEHHEDEHIAANEQPLIAEPQPPAANAQPPEGEHQPPAANAQLPEGESQPPAETIISVEEKPYIPPINFNIEQNIAKYTTYMEFDYLDFISNALSTRNNLLKHNFMVNMVAAGDNDYPIKKGGWIQVLKSISKQKGNTLTFKNNQQGFILGFDAQPLDELIIGIAYANVSSYTKFQSIFNDKQNTILHIAAVYSKYTLSPNIYLSSYLKCGKAFIKNLGKTDTISINSKTNGYVGRAKLETHYKVDLDKILFEPMVGIIFDRFLIRKFTEYRKDFNINVPTRKGKKVSLETGIDFSKRILVKNIAIIPKVHFKLDRAILLNNSTDIINFTNIEHPTQTVAITKSLRPSPKNVMYTLGGCINMQSVSALELGAGYDYSLKKSFTTHSFYVNGSMKF